MSDEILADLDAVSGSRNALYSFLSRLFEKELTEEILRELQEKTDALSQLSTLKGLGNKKLNAGLEDLDSFMKSSRSGQRNELQKSLAVEFAGLFQGAWPKSTHPSESAYTQGTKSAKEKKREQVIDAYKSVGLDKASSFNEPEDHIAVELQFMSYLAKETMNAAKARDAAKSLELLKVQQKFLKNHLGRWAGLLAGDVSRQAKSAFYKGAALIAAGFVEEDLRTVEDFIEDVGPSNKGA